MLSHTSILLVLPCCGTSGCTWGTVLLHAAHILVSGVQQCICALLCHTPCGSTSYTLSIVPGPVPGPGSVVVPPSPGHTSCASFPLIGLPRTTPPLGWPNSSDLCGSHPSISSEAPLGGGVCPATQKETASGCGRQAFGPDVQAIPICALLLWKLPFQYRPTGSLLPPR